MKSRLFKFEKKIGWGELVAFLALIIAGVSLYAQMTSNVADIKLINDELTSGNFIDSDHKKKHFGLYRAFITNNGNKAVTIIGLKPHERTGLIVTTKKGSNEALMDIIPFKIFMIPDSMTSGQINANSIIGFKDQGLERLSRINKKIEPGEMYILNIGTVIDFYSDKTVVYDHMIFTSELHFSNGQKLNFGAGGAIMN